MTSSYLRNLLYQLLNGLSTLKRLRTVVANGAQPLPERERKQASELIAFLRQVGQDMHRYLSSQEIPGNELGSVYINFQAALSLTSSGHSLQSPAYAVQPRGLDDRVWSKTIRGFGDEQKALVDRKLEGWVSLLESVLEGTYAISSVSSGLDELATGLERTSHLVERALQ
jgi:hypothetical protein